MNVPQLVFGTEEVNVGWRILLSTLWHEYERSTVAVSQAVDKSFLNAGFVVW
jgi:hypothetical protein